MHILKALELSPQNEFYYVQAVDIYTKKGSLDEAAKIYEDLIIKIPGKESYLLDLATIYLFDQDYEKAIDAFNRAEQVYGLNEEFSIQKQKIYLKLNQLEPAIAEILTFLFLPHFPIGLR